MESKPVLKKMPVWMPCMPWLLVLGALILASLVVIYDARNARREAEITEQLLAERGEALLLALQATLQTSVNFQWLDVAVQDVLERMGSQKNIRYLAIMDDEAGLQTISLPNQALVFPEEKLRALTMEPGTQHAVLESASGVPLFLVYKKVSIDYRKHRRGRGHGMRTFERPERDKILIAGYDMSPIQEARDADLRHTMIFSAVLFVIGLAGLLSFYLVRLYRLSCARLEEANSMLLRQTRLAALGTMAAGVAHEVRNPLSSISAAARIIQEGNPETSEESALALVIRQEVSRLDKVVGDLLDFSRQDILHISRVYVEDCVHKAQHMVQEELQARAIVFRLKMVKHPLMAFFDRDRMIQVLLNLFLNAVQAMPHGGALTVTAVMTGRMKGSPARHTLLIEVADTGEGIPEERLHELFSPYFTTKAKGTGLGLSIVHRIVEAHGGLITVKSTVGVGTVFSIRLPQNENETVVNHE